MKPRPIKRPTKAALGCALGLFACTALFASPALARSRRAILKAGKTLEYRDRYRDYGHTGRSHRVRIFLPEQVWKPKTARTQPVPALVFLHGLNRKEEHYRLAGAFAGEPDVRVLIGRMIDRGQLPPMVVIAPSTVLNADVAMGMWNEFDVERVLEKSARTIAPHAYLDFHQVVLLGHSAGGCNNGGGLFYPARQSRLALRAILAVDVCMHADSAAILMGAPAATDIYVTYQRKSWKNRPFGDFERAFRRARRRRAKSHPAERAVRVLDEYHPASKRGAHNFMVQWTLQKHLARILKPAKKPGAPKAVAPATAAPNTKRPKK